MKQLYSGSIKIKLHGEKLLGEFALVKTNGMGENGWLLIKHKDGFASKDDITKLDRSVISGKTIAGMAKTSEKVWQNDIRLLLLTAVFENVLGPVESFLRTTLFPSEQYINS